MRIDASRAFGAYAAVMTLAAGWLLLGGAGAGTPRFTTIDVERINVREPDGTLRLAIAGHARMPGIVVGAREYPHPNRPEAGMIFYNDEGVENGGLVFNGYRHDGRTTNGGSLTFDRWHQDQTVQMTSIENGADRHAGLIVNDQPDAPIDYAVATGLAAIPGGPSRNAAALAANLGAHQRAFLGRTTAGDSTLILRDGDGRPRIRITAPATGAPSIALLTPDGQETRVLK